MTRERLKRYGDKSGEVRDPVDNFFLGSATEEHYTPKKYMESVRKVMGHIDLDPASCEYANEVVQAKRILTKQDDGLQYEWSGKVFMNPPYGGPQAAFIQKLHDDYMRRKVKECIMLLRAANTGNKWFEPVWDMGDAFCFAMKRVRCYPPKGYLIQSPPFYSVFVYAGPHPTQFAEEFSKHGPVVRSWHPYKPEE